MSELGRFCVVWLHKTMSRDQRRRIYFPVYEMLEGEMSDDGNVSADSCGEGDGGETQYENRLHSK